MGIQLVQLALVVTLVFFFLLFSLIMFLFCLFLSGLVFSCIGSNQIKSGLLKRTDLPVLKKILVISVLCVSTAPQSLRNCTPIRLMMVFHPLLLWSFSFLTCLRFFILHLSQISLGMCPSRAVPP